MIIDHRIPHDNFNNSLNTTISMQTIKECVEKETGEKTYWTNNSKFKILTNRTWTQEN